MNTVGNLYKCSHKFKMHKSAGWGLGWEGDLFMSLRKQHPHFPMIRNTIEQAATEVHTCEGILGLIPFIHLGLQQLLGELDLMFLNCEAAGSGVPGDCTCPWEDLDRGAADVFPACNAGQLSLVTVAVMESVNWKDEPSCSEGSQHVLFHFVPTAPWTVPGAKKAHSTLVELSTSFNACYGLLLWLYLYEFTKYA